MEKPVTIIFTDDKSYFRKSMIEALADCNIETIAEAGNGKELLDCLTIHKPDVVLLDLQMPVMDGAETLRQLNGLYPDQKVIIFSYHDEAVLIEEYKKMGVQGYILKGESLSNVAWGIKNVSRGGTYFHTESLPTVKFSPIQLNIINMVAEGESQVKIAEETGLTTNAVYKQQQKIMKLLGVTKPNLLQRTIIERGLHFLRH